MSGRFGFAALAAWGCAHAPPPAPVVVAPPPPPPAKRELAVIPAESDAFPSAARAVSAELASAKVAGIDETRLSKVSLEVVQLAIECVEPTGACYQAVGRSLAVNQLLFARIDGGAAKAPAKRAGKRPLKVTVTLFDVDANAPAKTAEREFATEADATAGAAALVEEVTK